jgi:hypothetical protein
MTWIVGIIIVAAMVWYLRRSVQASATFDAMYAVTPTLEGLGLRGKLYASYNDIRLMNDTGDCIVTGIADRFTGEKVCYLAELKNGKMLSLEIFAPSGTGTFHKISSRAAFDQGESLKYTMSERHNRFLDDRSRKAQEGADDQKILETLMMKRGIDPFGLPESVWDVLRREQSSYTSPDEVSLQLSKLIEHINVLGGTFEERGVRFIELLPKWLHDNRA